MNMNRIRSWTDVCSFIRKWQTDHLQSYLMTTSWRAQTMLTSIETLCWSLLLKNLIKWHRILPRSVREIGLLRPEEENTKNGRRKTPLPGVTSLPRWTIRYRGSSIRSNLLRTYWTVLGQCTKSRIVLLGRKSWNSSWPLKCPRVNKFTTIVFGWWDTPTNWRLLDPGWTLQPR